MSTALTLEERILAFAALPDLGERRDGARMTFAELRHALSEGKVRSAEPDPNSPTGWKVNTWVKQGILLGFRCGALADVSADHGKWPFFDKDTLPLRKFTVASNVRVVPGGSTVRDGAYVGPGVICVPPMFINIGAYVGEGTLVDSHALIGGNTGVYEGAVIKAGAVLAAGTVLTGSTPVYDLVKERIIKPEPGQPLVIPEHAVVVPGARAVTVGIGAEWRLSLATPVIV